MSSGTVLTGGKTFKRDFTLDEIPVYVKSGAIIPTLPDESKSDTLVLNIFPGNEGKTVIYDDEGNNQNFESGNFSLTKINYNDNKILINPVEGAFPGMPEKRKYELNFPLTLPPVSIKINGQISEEWNYNGNELTTKIFVPEFNVNEKIEIDVTFSEMDVNKLSGFQRKIRSLIKFMKFLAGNNWDKSKYSNDLIVWFAQTGHRMTLNPQTAENELNAFDENWNKIIDMIKTAASENSKYMPYFNLLKK